jgi:hypothetical protein
MNTAFRLYAEVRVLHESTCNMQVPSIAAFFNISQIIIFLNDIHCSLQYFWLQSSTKYWEKDAWSIIMLYRPISFKTVLRKVSDFHDAFYQIGNFCALLACVAGPQFYGGPDLQRAGFWRARGRNRPPCPP